MSSNKGWKYGMIVVEIDDDGEETCELVELYNLEGEGYNSFCRARIMSPEELANDYEEVPTPDEEMTKIIMAFGYPDAKTIPWAGTIRDFIGENADIEECVRYVIAFDN